MRLPSGPQACRAGTESIAFHGAVLSSVKCLKDPGAVQWLRRVEMRKLNPFDQQFLVCRRCYTVQLSGYTRIQCGEAIVRSPCQVWASPPVRTNEQGSFMSGNVTVIETKFTGVRVEVRTPSAFDDVVNRLTMLCGKSSIPELIRLASEDTSEATYVNEVERRFVGESGFMLFSEIDHGSWITKFGINRRTVRWILGNPLIAITMLRHDLTAGLFAPVEILVTESEDGDGTIVTYVRPSSLIVIGDHPQLKDAALALDQKFALLIDRITLAE